ncbi:serine/threonine-protein kinase [Candidatus Uabimicrobium amorphum]|uniref:non-specific serine/threonine protein kinase n=1 Tax=Uabimicrobium amorphum TaxID=2596890 RepID=A0A5S9F1E9_UABAM|nr:serine/threonine-protein kinase [Candidatus Uabimicrobium amorphum]BBM82595.1 protein kinase [Candidatus Uabimicrobium amorphum]
MSDSKPEDVLFAQKALELKITTPQAISVSLKLQQHLRQLGRHVSLSDCLMQNKHVNNSQVDIVRSALSWQSQSRQSQAVTQPFSSQHTVLKDKFLHYHVLQELGRGGMGAVYKVYDPRSERPVALKILLSSGGRSEIGRFLQEAKTLAKLDHPNIVKVYEVGDHDNLYYTMEYLVGHDLSFYTESQNHLSPNVVADIFCQIANAVHGIHEEGIVHRDIKPANIVLTKDNHPKLMDFGLIKKKQSDRQFSCSGQVIGTAYYMSPEQINGQKIGKRSDIYSIGATMYEVLTGTLPFYSPVYATVAYKITKEDPLPPRSINPQIPTELEAICLQCLQKNPYKRYNDAKSLEQDLRNFLRGDIVSARRYTKLAAAQTIIRRNKLLVSSVCTIFLVIVAAIILYISMYKQYSQTLLRQKQNALSAAKKAFTTLYSIYEINGALKENVQLIQQLNDVFRELEKLDIMTDLEKHIDVLMLYGIVCSETEELRSKGIEIYDKIIEKRPRYAKAYTNRGLIYQKMKDYKRAIRDYNEAIKINNDYKAFTNRGYIYLNQNNYELAERDFDKAISLNADNGKAYGNKGILYRRQKKYQRALECYAKAIELSPISSNLYSNRGLLHEEMRNFSAAMKDYKSAILHNPKYYGVYCNRGKLYARLGQQESAKEDYLHALKLNPDFYQVHNNLGMVYMKQNNYSKALFHIKKAIELHPKHSNAYANLGVLYQKQGKNKQAIAAWRKAISLGSEHKRVLESYIRSASKH